MAKPIEPTPTLKGKEAVQFLQRVFNEQKKPTPARIKLLEDADKTKFKVKI
ncbi:hypothetical protein HYX13_02605 [Candidatus Woesearchaeota archaeon]|nr:hypothetical protein [Candidatus Woesearchaeota archaeon]